MVHSKQLLPLTIALSSACVSTTGVEAPTQTDPSSSFEAIVTIEVAEGGTGWGCIGVLVPIDWTADSVTYSGPSSGSMSYIANVGALMEVWYPSSQADQWIGFYEETYGSSEQGDVYEVTVRIHTAETSGIFELAFLGLVHEYADWVWEGDPCSITVEVVEMNLEAATWAEVKSQSGGN